MTMQRFKVIKVQVGAGLPACWPVHIFKAILKRLLKKLHSALDVFICFLDLTSYQLYKTGIILL